jgi:hypothetical protein
MTAVCTARQWLIRIALCGATGAVMTVAAAWTLALMGDRLLPDGGDRPLWSWASLPQSSSGAGWSYWIEKGRMNVVRVRRIPGIFASEHQLPDAPRAPSWSAVNEPPLRDAIGTWFVGVEDARGWPQPAMYSDTILAPRIGRSQFNTTINHGILIQRNPAQSGKPASTIPLRPIWPGFAIDAVFYGAMAFAFLFGPGIVRHSLRQRRGACVRCGYDLRGTAAPGVCPECGGVMQRVRGGEDAAR